MATLFALSALLQLNDAHPWVWILFYLAAAAAPGLAAAHNFKCARIIAGIMLAIAVLWEISYIKQGAWRVPFWDLAEEWQMKNEQIILGREFYALIWIGCWMGLVLFNTRSSSKSSSDQTVG
jgi:hypothetical protein